MPAQLCFRDHVGLPGQPNPPNIDGFVEPEDTLATGFGTTASEVDTGWTGAARITYVADTAVGAGRPLMVFQCLKDRTQDFVYLSFVARRDTQFEDNDCIVLVLRPTFPGVGDAKDGSERRIDIYPNSQGTGAQASGAPRNIEYYKWSTATSTWVNMGAGAVNNVTIRCRSWDAGVNNKNWSVEVKLPTTVLGAAGGGANWITLTNSFGFYYNLIRICSGTECSVNLNPFDGAAFEFTWPRANYTTRAGLIHDVDEISLSPIPLDWLGQAFLGTVAGCAGVQGVRFQNGENSIGVLSGSTVTNQIHITNPNTFVARVVNTGATPAQAVAATFRIANWGIGPGSNNKWNPGPATGGTANPTIPPKTIPSSGAPIDLTMEWQLTAPEKALYGTPPAQPLDKHQCIWVLLDSVQAVDFVESSVRRNCDFYPLSELEQVAEISGDGYPAPPNGAADQEMVLIVSQMRRGRLVRRDVSTDFNQRSTQRLQTAKPYSGGREYREPSGLLGNLIAQLQNLFSSNDTVIYDWVWVMDGYRQTEFELRVNGKRHLVHEPVGAFGYIAEHEGLVSSWQQSVTPAAGNEDRFGPAGRDAYRLRVPHGGKAHIITRLKAEEFRMPWWLWPLLFLLLLLFVKVLGQGN